MKNISRNWLLLILVVLAWPTMVDAQKKEMDLETAIMQQWRSLRPESLNQVNWSPNSAQFAYYDFKTYSLYVEDLKGSKRQFRGTDFNAELQEQDKAPIMPYSFVWASDEVLHMNFDNKVYVFDLQSKKAEMLYEFRYGAADVTFNEDYSKVAYTIGSNLYMASAQGEVQITNDPDGKGIVNGQTVHRSEFGISGGIFWSPAGEKIAFYHKDESMVSNYPLVNTSKRVGTVNNTRYAMAGMTSEQVQVHVYDIAQKDVTVLQTEGPDDHYLTNLAWGPKAQYIYLAEVNRGQNHMHFNSYRVADGAFVKTLFEEQEDTWVEPEHPAVFIPGRPNEFLWRSERDGYMHFYRYDVNGKLLNQVTKGAFVVTDFYGFSKGNILFQATANNALDRVVMSSSYKNDKSKTLSKTSGTHSAVMSKDGKYYINSFSSLTIPGKTDLMDIKGKVKRNLVDAVDPAADYQLSKVEFGSITNDGVVLNTRTIYPSDFDETKKYPVLIYVYGGPHAQLVKNSWYGGANLWMHWLAEKGYIVFTLDNRGSADRGKAFEEVIHRQLGVVEMSDQMAGVAHLKSLPYVDQNRLAVDGWSFGGFMTTNLMTSYPDVFKAGAAGGPVIDWKWYEVMYGERYMDTPQENPEGYANSNVLSRAKDLKGDLLMIHGADDPVVVWQHSQEFVRACVDAGVQLDYFVYPGHEHNVLGKDRVHLFTKILNHIMDHNK